MAKRRPSGDGMVRKRDDGRWEGRIVVGHKKNGDPIFHHDYANTQKELTDKLHQSIERYQDVELTEDSRMTLGEWLDIWLEEYKEGTIRPSTMKCYRQFIDCYIKPQLGHKQVSLITSQDIQRMYRRLKKEGRIHEHAEDGYGLSDATVNHIHTMLHGAMKDAVQAHIIPKNPTEGPTAPRPNYKPKRILNEQELDTFMEVIRQDEVWYEFFYTELMTGLRRGEICGLMWKDFDEKKGTLKVCRTLHSKKMGVFALGDTKTSKGTRTIILPPSIVELLRQRKKLIVRAMEHIFIRVIKQGKDGGSLQCGIIFHPLFRLLEQVALLKPNALHERLDCQNVVFRAVCRLGCRNASRCTEFIGAANRGFLSGKEAIDVITEEDDFAHQITDLCNLDEHIE